MKPNESLLAKVNAIDLEAITYKVTTCPEGPQWSLEKAFHAEKWYRRFLYLTLQNPETSVIPTSAIDEYWHYHILDSQKYMKDCEFLFGSYLHHFPYLGLRGDADVRQLENAFKTTLDTFQNIFGETPEAREKLLFRAEYQSNQSIRSGSCGKTCGRGTCASDGITSGDPWQLGVRPQLGVSYQQQIA